MRNRHLGFVAAAATLLAAAPLSAIYERWTWLIQCAVAVALIAGAATLARSLRAPLWAQLLGMAATLLLTLTIMFPSGDELLFLIPTPDTFSHFSAMTGFALEDMRSYGVPVPDRPGLQFITVLGVGAVAILVDLLTVSMRRPALAGLPMLAIYSVPVAVYTTSVPPLPFVVGAIGFLWLLAADNVDRVRRFGRRFTGDGRDVDVWEPSPLAAAGRRLAVVGVVLAVLVPLAVPGMTSGLLANVGQGGTGPGGTGRGGRVDLFAKLSGDLNQSSVTDLLKVTTNDPNPFYLRFGVAEQITNEGFRSMSARGTSVNEGLEDPRRSQPDGVRYREYQARVEVTEDFDMPMLPVYSTPISVDDVEGRWNYDPGRQMLWSTAGNARSKNKKYGFNFVRADFSPAALRGAEIEENAGPNQFVETPPVEQVDDLVAQVTRGKSTQYDKVLAIHQYFSATNGFKYSLVTETGTSGSAIVDFLTNKIGFCQQYASAMAWMVRSAGYPARVAFGFTRGSQSSSENKTWTLTNKNLHAWTEVYFGEDFGWVPFDATPSSSVLGSARSAWDPDPDVTEAPEATPGATTAPGTDPTANPSTPQDEGNDAADLGAGLDDTTPTQATWPWYTIASILVVLLLLSLPALRRRLLRRSRFRAAAAPAAPAVAASGGVTVEVDVASAGRAREDAHAAWAELLDTMVDYRVPIDPTETPRATADRLVTSGLVSGPATDSARLLGQAEERARYARQPLQGGRLSDSLRTVRRAIASQAGRRTRLAAAILPPSVLLRWRLAIVEASIRTVSAAGRVREVFARWSPRRLLPNRR
ncbi:transglutaminaseTgpA domain-containing protein [Micromonospora sp. CPCC 205371]|nr:transglutaminaseTgpA domain-containing protein [Micromonospora sp. CPCC 205371]